MGRDLDAAGLAAAHAQPALNRPDEFRLHLRAAFNNGVTRDEVREVLMHCAIYAGVPAANSAFHWAEEVFAQMDAGAT